MLPRITGLALIGLVPLAAHAGGIYWSDRGANLLKRMDFDGSNLQVIALSGAVNAAGNNIRGIAFDARSNRVYWADNGSDRLLRANADGTGAAVVYTIAGGNAFPADIRLDLDGGFLYWCDQTRSRIQRSGLDGGNVVDVITNAAPTGPYFMDLDPVSGRVYWGDFGGGSIFRANLDGSGRETLLTGNNGTRGVRLDPQEGMLYWINRDAKKVHRCPLSAFAGGTLPLPLTHPAVQTLYTNLDTPHGLVLDRVARKLYWADTGTNPGNGEGGQSICRGDFDGATPLEILASGAEPWDVDLDLRCVRYEEWVKRCFRREAPAASTGPEADPDGDGLPNAAEYAFELAPMHADGAGRPEALRWVDPMGGGAHLAIRFRRRVGAGDLRQPVQRSRNLVRWEDSGLQEVGAIPVGDGVELVTVRTTEPWAERNALYLRVQVILAP